MAFRTQRAIERLEDRLRAVELKCDEQERQYRSLALEYEELWDKVRHNMSRISKRLAVSKKEEEIEPASENANETSGLLDPISESILLRRGMRPGTT